MPKGKHIRTLEYKNKISTILKGRFVGENSSQWKGDSIGNKAFHKWLFYNYGKANKCENISCDGLSKNFEWANINNHQYRRIREDYIMLCKKCHHRYDFNNSGARKGFYK